MIRTRASRAFTAAAVLVTVTPAGAILSPVAAGETLASKTEVRAADHQGFGRVVLNTNGKVAYKVDQEGDHVTVQMTGNVSLGAPPSAPRNVVAIKTNGATLDLMLTPGAQVRTSRVNGHIVLDVMDVIGSAAKNRGDEVSPHRKCHLRHRYSPYRPHHRCRQHRTGRPRQKCLTHHTLPRAHKPGRHRRWWFRKHPRIHMSCICQKPSRQTQ